MPFTDPHESESVKGAVHGALLAGIALCGAYNAIAWWVRRDPRLALNATIYAAMIAFEVSQVLHHTILTSQE